MGKRNDRSIVLLMWVLAAALLLRPMVVYAQNSACLAKVQAALQDDPPSANHSGSIFGHNHLMKKIAKQVLRAKYSIVPAQKVHFSRTGFVRQSPLSASRSFSKPFLSILRI